MNVLITLGPTQEPIDPIRYITNASSGKMGKALTEESLKRGYKTTVVSGPINLKLPDKSKILSVTSAKEMTEVSLKELEKGYQVFISTAAIADYSPRFSENKIRSDKNLIALKLKLNPKLTRLAKEKFPELYVVAFKAEYDVAEDELINAGNRKIRDEEIDMVIANDTRRNKFGGDKNEVYILSRDKKPLHIPQDTKTEIAKKIWETITQELKCISC